MTVFDLENILGLTKEERAVAKDLAMQLSNGSIPNAFECAFIAIALKVKSLEERLENAEAKK